MVSALLNNYEWKVGDQSNQYKIPFAEWKKSQALKGPEAQVEYRKQKAEKTIKNTKASWKMFETNLEMSIKKHGIIKGNSIMMQMVDFLYVFHYSTRIMKILQHHMIFLSLQL